MAKPKDTLDPIEPTAAQLQAAERYPTQEEFEAAAEFPTAAEFEAAAQIEAFPPDDE